MMSGVPSAKTRRVPTASFSFTSQAAFSASVSSGSSPLLSLAAASAARAFSGASRTAA